VYFQALDAKGHAVQTMRSWATLQPGETASCVGCHESKNTAPPATAVTQALKAGPQDLRPWYGPPRGFSFRREIQPILDRHCIRCHNVREKAPPEPVLAGSPAPAGAAGAPAATRRAPPAPAAGRPPDPAGPAPDEKKPAFSLLDAEVVDAKAKRKWSDAYLALTSSRPRARKGPSEGFAGQPENDLVNWVHAQSAPPMLPPYSAGAAKSRLITMLEQGHNGVKLTREELDKVACWIDLLVPFCGDYVEANAWSPEEAGRYQHFLEKRRRAAAEAGDPPVTAPPASR
jgi:hypothetical protein